VNNKDIDELTIDEAKARLASVLGKPVGQLTLAEEDAFVKRCKQWIEYHPNYHYDNINDYLAQRYPLSNGQVCWMVLKEMEAEKAEATQPPRHVVERVVGEA